MDECLESPPYPWFGGKSAVADLVWDRFGDPLNYVEPFFGGGAIWRLRPHYPWTDDVCRRETINDYDGHVANFWRAVQADPEKVAEHADWPVNEIDLHARGDWLYCRPESKAFVEQMRADPDYYCPKIAGWWVWFVANWIGVLPSVDGNAHCNDDGVYRKRPHLGSAGQGVSRQLPHLQDAGQGECDRRRAVLIHWMTTLRDRLRGARVCCGDWKRVCGPSVTWKNASPCAVFLDPPYSAEAKRDGNLYSVEDLTVAHNVRGWCIEEGHRPEMRICLAGYEGEGHEELEQHGWSVVTWKAQGGYAGQNSVRNDNCHRERLWFSPYCINPTPGLFDGLE